jgi:hypothetical protein
LPHQEHKIDGEKVPSVTTITGLYTHPGLLFWYGKYGTAECTRVKNESAKFGDGVHAGVEAFFRTGSIPEKVESKDKEVGLTERQKFLVGLVAKWADESKFVPKLLEQPVLCIGDRYGGTFDALGTFGNDPTLFLLDWKTSNQFDDKMRLQVSAYAHAYNEMADMPGKDQQVTNGGIIRLAKDPAAEKQFEVLTFNNLDQVYPVFQGLRVLYDYLNRKGRFADIPKLPG